MYHHRYQPQTSNLANRNQSAFASNIHSYKNNKNSSSSISSYHNSNRNYSKPDPLIEPALTSPAASGASTSPPAANLESAAYPSSGSSSGAFNIGSNYRNSNTTGSHPSPFSSLPKQFVEERQDVIFRRVRGILNKITPETFDKLTKELVNVGLDSPRTLRGVIYLLFDKALKDLKYSSLYAKLCQELSEKAPNFERDPGPNTFCKFLISKCEDEFERRRKATEDFDRKNELTDEEFEQRTIAKQKMLGNIKFICELGKKRLLQEEILHECIRGLLSKKKKEKPVQDQAQDLECLCQIMRTIGSLLDIDASRNLMNQYFERIDMFSKKPELPSRIRFMLRDVIDLRNNNWRPRPFQREDNVPQPLSKLREDLGFGGAAQGASVDKLSNKNLLYINDLSKLSGGKINSLLLDDEPSFTTTTDFHWGSSYLPNEHAFDIFSNTVPNAKIGSARDPLTSDNTLTKSSAINYIDVSKLTSPTSLINSFDNYKMSGVNERIDPFSDSFKSKPNSNNHAAHTNNNNNINNNSNNKNSNSNGDRRLASSEPNHLSQGYSKRNDMHQNVYNQNTRGAIRDPTTSQNYPHMRANDDRSNLNSRIDRGNILYNDPRGPPRNEAPYHNSRLSPNRDYNQPFDMNRIPFDDAPPRAAHSQRRLDNLHDSKQSVSRFNPVEPIPPHASLQQDSHARLLNNHGQPVQSLNHPARLDSSKNQQLPPGQQQGFNLLNDRGPGKERRFGRGEPRQPKFSGANYKLPGRDRHAPPPPALARDRVPDSELSHNWRADAVAVTPKAPDLTSQQSNANETHESKPGLNSSQKAIDHQPRVVESSQANKVSSTTVQQNVEANESLVRSPKLTSDMNERKPSSPVGSRQQKVLDKNSSTSPNRDAGSRRNQDGRPALLPPSFQTRRSNNHEHKDRRDGPRRQAGPPIEFDGRVFQRAYPNESSSLERRNNRPAMPRNQSFEGTNNNDSRRAPIWRKDGSSNNSKGSNAPTTPSAITSSLLSRTTSRPIGSDFSLRPSHNLMNRSPASNLSQSATAIASNAVTIAPTPIDQPAVENPASVSKQEPSEPQEPIAEKKQTAPEPQIQETQVKKTKPQDQQEIKVASPILPKSGSILSHFETILSDACGGESADHVKAAARIKELKVSKPSQVACLSSALKLSIIKSDKERSGICKILSQVIPSSFEISAMMGAFQMIFEQLQGMEVETPKVKSLVAGLLSQTTVDGLLSISDVATMLGGGKHHPMFLLYLQKLDKLNGKAWLSEKFIASKISLMDMLPEVDRSKDRLAVALKDRCLGFLDPMLTIEPDLWEQMTEKDPSAAAIYRWIRENVDQSIQGTKTFAHVFVRCLLRYIHNSSMECVKNTVSETTTNDSDSNNAESQSNKSSPVNAVIQAISEHERELLSKYQHILQAILKNKELQLATLYALQAFYHSLDFPKGALLRWFHLLYDMSIVDDDVYFTWKEEINDQYPGKGQALFQVNTWLHWLAEAESEEEDEE